MGVQVACSISKTPKLYACAFVALTDRRPTKLTPLQRRRNLLDLAALLHLDQLDISSTKEQAAIEFLQNKDADCLKLAELTMLQALNVSRNCQISDSGFKVRNSAPFLRSPHRLSPDMPGLPLHSRHMSSFVKLLSFRRQGAAEADQDLRSAHTVSSLTHCTSYFKQALLSMPRLRILICDWLDLADWQYAEYKNRYRSTILLIASMTEREMLVKDNRLDHWT